jgi:hypothetical protein
MAVWDSRAMPNATSPSCHEGRRLVLWHGRGTSKKSQAQNQRGAPRLEESDGLLIWKSCINTLELKCRWNSADMRSSWPKLYMLTEVDGMMEHLHVK